MREEANYGVELVAMQDQQAPSVRRRVHCTLADMDVAENHAVVVTQQLVVVARYIGDPGAVLGLAEYRADHVVVQLWPVQSPFHLPDVDDVADEVEMITAGAAEELEEHLCVAAPESEMDVGDPDRSVPT